MFSMFTKINRPTIPDFKRMSDKDILKMLVEKKPKALEHLYDKYGAAMFTITFKLAGDKAIAEKIFIDAFVELHEKKILADVTNGLCIFVLRHTYNFAIAQLKVYGINPTAFNQGSLCEVIDLLCTKCITIKQVASQLGITEAAAKKKLQGEFHWLRYQKGNTECKENQQTKLLEANYDNNLDN
jgi:hypothetical protein